MSDPSAPQGPEPTPFQKFDAVMRQIIRVPKAEVERRSEEAKKQRAKRKHNHA